MTQIFTGSIRNKDTNQRDPFLIVGTFNDRKSFLTTLEEDFDRDTYDYRTIRFAQDIMIPKDGKGRVFRLDELTEDLEIK